MQQHSERHQLFCDAVYTGAPAAPDLINAFEGNKTSATHRFEIYRRSVVGNLVRAVVATYPVTCQIVGESFFNAAARAYLKNYPSQCGDLNEYGEHFAQFIGAWPHAATLPYLADFANLEWAVQQVYYAADAVTDLSTLASCPPQYYGMLQASCPVAFRRLDSAWPLDAIWRVNAPDYSGDMTVDFSQNCSLAIVRRNARVHVDSLQPGQCALLDALLSNHTLGQALSMATAADPDFDLNNGLAQAIQSGYISQFYLPTPLQETP